MNVTVNLENVFLTVAQVAERYSVVVDSIWRWKRNGELPASVRVGPGSTRWKVSDLLKHESQFVAGFITSFSWSLATSASTGSKASPCVQQLPQCLHPFHGDARITAVRDDADEFDPRHLVFGQLVTRFHCGHGNLEYAVVHFPKIARSVDCDRAVRRGSLFRDASQI